MPKYLLIETRTRSLVVEADSLEEVNKKLDAYEYDDADWHTCGAREFEVEEYE
jgi:hypothetical protein